MEKIENQFYSGTSGLVLPFPKYRFPDEFKDRSRLAFYASLFNSIEINRSFYVMPSGQTLQKWSREVPDDFKFTFKLWKEITHTKGGFLKSDVRKFIDAINHVDDKKGCLLIQFPASMKGDQHDLLRSVLAAIKEADPDNQWKPAIEFRDRSWYDESTYELLQQFSTTIVIHDKSGVATSPHGVDSEFIYVRFHGPKGDYRGNYTDDFLHEYASYINEWRTDGKSVFAYFNNTIGDALNNLITLNRMVRDLEN